jgi:5-methylcytosine-specific restriction endonuclease McrA
MPKAYKQPLPGEPFDPDVFRLGAPCKGNHIHANGLTLRYIKHGKCLICERAYALQNQRRLRENPAYRLYQRSESKARKVAKRGGTPTRLSPVQLWQHWDRFEHCCAYCGCSGDLEIEHVIPISKGGEHHLGNIVPACTRCNTSKRSRPAEKWYRAQPFFSDAKWEKIQAILAKSMPMTEQLPMPLPD